MPSTAPGAPTRRARTRADARHRVPRHTELAPGAASDPLERCSRLAWRSAGLGLVLGLAALLVTHAPAAKAAPPTVIDFAWSGPSGNVAGVGGGNVTLVSNLAQADEVTIQIQAPPNIAINQVTQPTNQNSATWNKTIVRLPGSNPWVSSATITNAAGAAGSIGGSFVVNYTSRNGGFAHNQVVTFRATITARNGDGTTTREANYELRLTSQPTAGLTAGQHYTYNGVFQGQVGVFREYTWQVTETGNGRAEADQTFVDVDIPAPGLFVSPATGSNWVVISQPTQGGNGTLRLRYRQPIGVQGAISGSGAVPGMGSGQQNSQTFGAIAFVPCGVDLPTGGYRVSSAVEMRQDGHTNPFLATLSTSAVNATSTTNCHPGLSNKQVGGQASAQVAVGGNASYTINARTTMLDSRFPTNVVVVDRLPQAGMNYQSASIDTGRGFSQSFQLFLCRAGSQAGTFPFATFDLLRNALTGEICRPASSFDQTQGPPTHVVAFAAQWRDAIVDGAEPIYGIKPVQVDLSLRVRNDATGPAYVNRMCLHRGDSGPAASPWVGPFEDAYAKCTPGVDGGPPSSPSWCGQACVSLTADATLGLTSTIRNQDTQVSLGSPFNRGDVVEIWVRARRQSGANPFFDPAIGSNRIRIDLHPGLEFLSATQFLQCTPDLANANEFEYAAAESTVLGNGRHRIVLKPTTALAINDCRGNGNMGNSDGPAFRVRARVSFTWPFVNNTNYEVPTSANASNAAGTATSNPVFRVNTPPQVRVTASAGSCTLNAISQLTTFDNQGGQDLTDVLVTVPVPAGADLATVGTPTFLDAVTGQPPSPALTWTIEYEVANSWSTTPPASLGSVSRVRLVVPTLPPYVSGEWATGFAPNTSGSGSFVYQAAIIANAAGLSTPLQTDSSTPFSVEGCPSNLHIVKTLGSSSTTPLAGITFRVTGPYNFERLVTTNAMGEIRFDDIAPGFYTVEELVPATFNGASVTPPFSGAWSTTVTVDPRSTFTLPIANDCVCVDAPCVNEGTCGWDPERKRFACDSTPVECAGADQCGGVCDPERDACVSSEPEPCDQPGGHVIWGAVLVDGHERYFRCVTYGTGLPPVCDLEPGTGLLALYPSVGGGQCAP